jgi:large subunit ribosomal protein L18
MDKKSARQRRARKTRARIRELHMHRLCVNRTPRHIYAQIISPDGDKVLAAVSTVQADIKGDVKYTGNADAAAAVGKNIAEKAKAAGVSKVAFDRSGFKYHGRIKALADAAREAGLEF